MANRAVVASGDIPDIMYSRGDSNFYKWAGQGAFLSLDDFIEQYPSFKLVPPLTLNAGRVNGKVYAIPQYYPPYSLTPSIRQDWLDKLDLKMPTSYDELKQVALVFTKQDPSGRGAGKTYGIAMGQTINPSYAMGAWWDPESWLHKDDQGRLLLGSITDASKERSQFLAELYAEGAVSRSSPSWTGPRPTRSSTPARPASSSARGGMSQDYMAGLLQIDPATGGMIDVLEVPLQFQDLWLTSPPWLAPTTIARARRHHVVDHFLFHQVHLHTRPEVVEAMLATIDLGPATPGNLLFGHHARRRPAAPGDHSATADRLRHDRADATV